MKEFTIRFISAVVSEEVISQALERNRMWRSALSNARTFARLGYTTSPWSTPPWSPSENKLGDAIEGAAQWHAHARRAPHMRWLYLDPWLVFYAALMPDRPLYTATEVLECVGVQDAWIEGDSDPDMLVPARRPVYVYGDYIPGGGCLSVLIPQGWTPRTRQSHEGRCP